MKFLVRYKSLFFIGCLLIIFSILIFKNTFGLRTFLFLDTKIHDLEYVQNNIVIQRSDSGLTLVNFSGHVGLFADAIQAEILNDSDKMVEVNKWKLLAPPSGTHFNAQLPLPDGINKIFLRSLKYKKSEVSPRQFNSIRVGIGEVFIVVGQSNASGSSKTLFCSNSGMVFSGQLQENGKYEWKTGDDPQIAGGGGSVWPLVGDSLSRLLKVPIGFINIAVGSSSINDWDEGSPAYNQLINAIKTCEPNGVRAILWHQGETDIYMPSEQYYNKLAKIIKSSQTQMQRPIPWVIAKATFQTGKKSMGVRAAQQLIIKNGLAIEGPDTDTLRLSYREAIDKVHFNKKGTIAASNLWIEALMKNLYNK